MIDSITFVVQIIRRISTSYSKNGTNSAHDDCQSCTIAGYPCLAIRSTPLRKAAEPSDIAAALAFLSSPMAGHITGQTLVIDGGVSLMNWRELTDVGSPDVSP